MADETMDLWGVLDDAEQTVEQWEGWRKAIEVDLWSAATEATAPHDKTPTAR